MVLDSSIPADQLSTEISGKMPPSSVMKSPPAPSFAIKFISAGLAACAADLVTFPLDTAKVRLQIQGEKAVSGLASTLSATNQIKSSPLQSQTRHLQTQANSTPYTAGTATAPGVESAPVNATRSGFKYRGIFRTIYVISSEEGVRALYNGLVAGLHRQLCFASVRIGCYDSVKNAYIKFYHDIILGGKLPQGGATDVGLRIMAGVTTGAAAVVFAQPTDVVKIRMQAQQGGVPKRYKGTFEAYQTIAKNEGVKGLWKGVAPNVARNAIVNAAELVSYDLIKEAILRRRLLSDNMPCHFVSAFGAGFCTTVVASPVDVVKTRYMNSASGIYKGAIHCAVVMYKEGGFWAFYKGFMPSFVRLGSWNICMFVTFEQLKRLFSSFHN